MNSYHRPIHTDGFVVFDKNVKPEIVMNFER